MRRLKPYKGMTVDEFAARHFTPGTPIFRLFTGLGYPRMEVATQAGMFVVVTEDYWHLKDGMQHWADLLADRFRAKGGDLRLRWQDDWHRNDPDAYRALKTKVRETLIARAEALFSGLRDAIESEDAATPLTYERYTGNTAGATSGWSWNPKRPFYEGGPFKATVTTPVRNLLIGSCLAGQIGGIPNALAASYLCAKKIG